MNDEYPPDEPFRLILEVWFRHVPVAAMEAETTGFFASSYPPAHDAARMIERYIARRKEWDATE